MDSRVREWLALVMSLAIIFALPILFDRGKAVERESSRFLSSSREKFDDRHVRKLQAVDPDYVFIGNSTLDTRIDAGYMDELLAPKKAYLLFQRGSASAIFYVLLKHHLVESGIRPDWVFIFFRDDLLTDPDAGLPDWIWDCVPHWFSSTDPVFDRIVSGVPSDWRSRAHTVIREVYPVHGRRRQVQGAIRRASEPWWFDTPMSDEQLGGSVNALFAPGNMRNIQEIEEPVVQQPVLVSPFDFQKRVGESFLPEIIRVARQADLRLCFVRIKRKPPAGWRVPQSEALNQYIRDLRDYVESNGCLFHDFTADTEITTEWYANKDYIKEEYRNNYTRKFIESLPEIFGTLDH